MFIQIIPFQAELLPQAAALLAAQQTRQRAASPDMPARFENPAVAQAHAAGYRFCETDWRGTNLLASRFWPRRGFCPAAYRLVRRVDPRMAWAWAWVVRVSSLG